MALKTYPFDPAKYFTDPKLTTVVKLLGTMKLKLTATPVKVAARAGKRSRKPPRSIAV